MPRLFGYLVLRVCDSMQRPHDVFSGRETRERTVRSNLIVIPPIYFLFCILDRLEPVSVQTFFLKSSIAVGALCGQHGIRAKVLPLARGDSSDR
jgi:hypothetical protein